MIFSAAKKNASLALTGAAMLAFSAKAQPNIQFSVPSDSKNSAKPNSIMSSATEQRSSAGAVSAPSADFDPNPGLSFNPLPGVVKPRDISTTEVKKWQKFLDGKKNWTMMSPAEIFGIQPKENPLVNDDPNAEEKLSTEVRFLQRQSRLADFGATNGARLPDNYFTANHDDPFHPTAPKDTPFGRPWENQGLPPESAGGQPNNAGDQPASFWNLGNRSSSGTANSSANPFGVPLPPPKPTQEQLDSKKRFHDLLNGTDFPDKPVLTARPTQLKSSLDGLFDSPGLNSGVRNGPQIGKPAGLKPLPGIGVTAPVAPVSTLTHLPPWLADPSAPIKFTDRQF